MLFYGMAGVGKTAIAAELAYSYEAGFARFVWYQAPDEGSEIATAMGLFALDLERQLPGLSVAEVVDRPAELEAWLPELTQFAEENRVLFVFDQLETLLTDAGEWRDSRWGQVIDALLAQSGFSRVVLASRIPPTQIDRSRLAMEPVHSLSLEESVLLLRELPHLRALLDEGTEETRRLLLRTLEATQGHPKLLEMADGQATEPENLLRHLERLGPSTVPEQRARERFLEARHSELSDEEFLKKLADWTRTVLTPLDHATRTLFYVLCAFEDDDRVESVIAATWAAVWRRLGQGGDPPAVGPTRERLIAAAVIERNEVVGGATYFRIHPAVAAAGIADAGEQLRVIVDAELTEYWREAFRKAIQEEQLGRGDLALRAARGAIPYLVRSNEWIGVSVLLEQVLSRDVSPSRLAWMLPLLRRLVEVSSRTDRESVALGLLGRALMKAGRRDEAEHLLREAIGGAVGFDQSRPEGAFVGDLITLLQTTGRSEEALSLVDQLRGATETAHLGPWTQLSVEVRHLELWAARGNYENVLARAETIREQMSGLSDQPHVDERVSPWAVREQLLNIAGECAMRLERWELALALNGEQFASKEARRAPRLELARTRFNDYGPLLRLRRTADARTVLEWCREIFQLERDIRGLALVFDALAGLEALLGHDSQAAAFLAVALRYQYMAGIPGDCAASHQSLSEAVLRESGDPGLATAHCIASGLIRLQTHDGRIERTRAHLQALLGAYETAHENPPSSFDEVVGLVEQVPGVRFSEMMARLMSGTDPKSLLADLLRG